VKKFDIENHFATEAFVGALYKNPGYPRFVDDPETGERHVYHSADFWTSTICAYRPWTPPGSTWP
jgi:hypothetical protein